VALAKPCSGSVHLGSSEVLQTQLPAQFLAPGDVKFKAAAGSIDYQPWFAVFTKSHHEKKVSHQLKQQNIESFLPMYSQVHQWTNRRRVTVQLPLFPNYIFVRIDGRERGRVLRLPGVLSIVGRGYDPAPLPDFEIESLRSGLHLRKFEPHPFLVVGTRVRIKMGALEGMEGVLLRNKNNLRVVLTVALINRGVAIEVDADDVEPVSQGYASTSLQMRTAYAAHS
jgi:transcription antitermination factor NusG